jgi:hypothetical protein
MVLDNDGMEFKISTYFYGGDLVNDDTFINMVKRVTSANIVGNHCIKVLIENDYIKEDSVIMIENVGHIQIYDLSVDE